MGYTVKFSLSKELKLTVATLIPSQHSTDDSAKSRSVLLPGQKSIGE